MTRLYNSPRFWVCAAIAAFVGYLVLATANGWDAPRPVAHEPAQERTA